INEIRCPVLPRKFSEVSGATFGSVPKCEPCSSMVRITSRSRTARRSNSSANAVTLSLAIANCSCSQRAIPSSKTTLKIPLEDSSSVRVAPKSWSISSGSQANQSSRTVRVRWLARLARNSPMVPPLRAGIIAYSNSNVVWPTLPCQRMSQPLYFVTILALDFRGENPLSLFEPQDQYLQRQKKLAEIETRGHEAYPHKFDWTATPAELVEKYASADAAALEASKPAVRVAGRIVALRLHGKAGFAHISGSGQRLQIYVKLDIVGPRTFELFQMIDLGDFVGVSGHLFRTRTGELTVWVVELTLLSKALLPLPEKWHGLSDVEMRYRQRYLDLIANERARGIFLRRAQIIRELRRFFV